MTDSHGRDHITDAEMAFDADGRIVGLRAHRRQPRRAPRSLPRPSRRTSTAPALRAVPHPRDPCRGDRRLHAHHAGRRLSRRRPAGGVLPDRAHDGPRRTATRRGPGRAAPPELHPHPTSSPTRRPSRSSTTAATTSRRSTAPVDGGLPELPHRAGVLRKQGRYVGVGLSCYIEACGLAPSQVVGQLGAQAGLYESAAVRVHPREGQRLHRLAPAGQGTRPPSRRSSPTASAYRSMMSTSCTATRGACSSGWGRVAAAAPWAGARSS